MSDIYIAGVSMTHFGKHLDRSLKDLTAEALNAALEDAGCEKTQLEAAFFGNCVQGHMEGQDMIRGEVALRNCGVQGIPVINVENACATASTAFHLAVNYVKAGAADIALAIGAEKMYSEDKAKMFSAFDGAWDVHNAEQIAQQWSDMGNGVEIPDGSTSPRPYSVFMDVYAGFSRMHMREFGTTQRQFAAIAAKNHGHSTMNPLAQYTKAFTVDEVMNAAPITYPLTIPMCSPISDGAAAAIVCNAAGLKKLNAAKVRTMRVLSTVVQTGSNRAATDLSNHCSALGSKKAYEQAGLGPNDMHVAEVHDASATGEVIESEALGFCAVGEGGIIAERGDTTLGGRIPINVSGGLESKGHPIGATGLGQIYELVTQLRSEAGARQVEGAQHAIAQNGGGIYGVEEAVACITIVGK